MSGPAEDAIPLAARLRQAPQGGKLAPAKARLEELVAAPPAGEGIDPTGHHYCVGVEDLDAAVAELEDRGIEYLRGVQGSGTVQIWIRDPAGNTVELQHDAGVA